jgi:hypothetical protein
MEKNLKLEDWIHQTVAAIIATQNAECDPDPNPLRRASELTEVRP